MGQLQSMLLGVERIEFDEAGNNGLILANNYIPEELLTEILFHVDAKTLLSCQLVCKRWYSALQTYVWRKKAETIIGRSLHSDKPAAWYLYYVICSKKSLEKNLIKNHSGKNGFKHWKIMGEAGDGWEVECPPKGAPSLPIEEQVFEGGKHCFATSYYRCSKEQTVDLIAEGLLPEFLETQPPIVISEWYCSRCDCPALYACDAKLIDESGKIMDTYGFQANLDGENQNKWLHVEHEFTNYGPGLRKVSFYHEGLDQRLWAGHYGSKMAGACIKVNLPKREILSKDPPIDSLMVTEI